ncbi:uncharacterized protein LOC123427635 [Hordeum vulgare subsp. vulgare]|uniref:uncharacterized protein LOC123427635 n=1 Tax=Hordeum vulgare subsp. vulgare TaxID=112509 RepID=UPI001D1A3394|nr:uncharacterized protein LOC123427635 [Hordeum vulgare subsp. vulgare]
MPHLLTPSGLSPFSLSQIHTYVPVLPTPPNGWILMEEEKKGWIPHTPCFFSTDTRLDGGAECVRPPRILHSSPWIHDGGEPAAAEEEVVRSPPPFTTSRASSHTGAATCLIVWIPSIWTCRATSLNLKVSGLCKLRPPCSTPCMASAA